MMKETVNGRSWFWDVAIPVLLLLVATVPRVIVIGPLTNPDELGWLNRSVLFYDALSRADWASTSQAFHPGVVPMWGFGGMILTHFGLDQMQNWIASDALPMGDLARSAAWFPILVSVVTVLGVYGLVRRLAGREAGLYSALLLAVAPYYMAFSHTIHMDLTHASLMLLSALFWINHLHQPRRWSHLLGSALFAGLAILTRSAAVYLLPFSLLAGGIYFLADNLSGQGVRIEPTWKRWIGRTMLAWLIWLAILATTVFLLWPALWVDPMAVISRLGAGIFKSVENAHPAPAYFMGQIITGDPGMLYYWLILLFRMRPLTLILSILNPALLTLAWRRLSAQRRAAWSTGLAYVAFYFVQMSLATHKLERYMLPVIVALVVLAGISLAVVVRWLSARLFKEPRPSAPVWRAGILGVAIVLLASPWLRLAPYFAAYFNPLVGGGEKAVELFTVGSGMGLDQAATYLNGKADGANLHAPSFYHYVFQYYLDGTTQRFTEDSWAGLPIMADYAVLTLGQAQRDVYPPSLDFFLPRQPEHTIRVNNIEYAWIYRVPRRELDDPPPLQQPLEANFEGRIQLWGYDTRMIDDDLQVTLYWQPITSMHRELLVTLRVVDQAGNTIAESVEPPWSGNTSVLTWPGGLAVQDEHSIPLPDSAATGQARLQVSIGQLYRDGQVRPLPLVDGAISELDLGPVDLSPFPEPSQPVEGGSLGGIVGLVGYDPPPPLQAEAGTHLPLTLTWQSLANAHEDYTVFIHLVGSDGVPLAQVDSEPLSGTYPTSFWRVGERLSDPYHLEVPSSVLPGNYELRVGMYLLSSGQRLPVLGTDGETLGDSILLDQVTITSP